MNKIIFLSRLLQERDKFELLLNRVGFSRRMTTKGVSGNLSIKDLLADVLAREQFIADRLNEILHGDVYSPSVSHRSLENFESDNGYPDYESTLFEKENSRYSVASKYRNIGVDDIVEQEIATYGNILAAFEKLTHDQCLDHDLYHRTAEHTYKSYRRTSIEINHWLQSIAPESY
ncbi:hypothetical protein [Candidatus Villigracilis affinis]|uniref:hypothetical protein n=1 Tax=Candidatus Villigracilis affinis TaxID=3140682 RepID=UPI001D3F7D04|nr:hypothetical protein [Anaerolineales bacterium]